MAAIALFDLGYIVLLEHQGKMLLLMKYEPNKTTFQHVQIALEMYAYENPEAFSEFGEVFVIEDINLFQRLSLLASIIVIQDLGDSPDLLLIFDGEAAKMWVSSPNADKLREPLRECKRIDLYVPRWSFKELEIANGKAFKKQLTEKDLMLRFHKFGGIPRHIFDTSGRSDADYQNAVCKLTLDELTRFFRSLFTQLPRDLISGILMHAIPKLDNIHESVCVPASEQAMNDLFDNLQIRLKMEASKFADTISGVPELRTYYARYLEVKMHDLFVDGITVQIRSLGR